jgi:hypothetical protein
MIARGSMNANEADWPSRSPTISRRRTSTYDPTLNGHGEQSLVPPPQRAVRQGEYLQMIEMVKEGFRRSIQAAMGSNFLPTQASRSTTSPAWRSTTSTARRRRARGTS